MVEVDPRADAIVDARTVRRLVELELADVEVPSQAGERPVVLFVRVLGAGDGALRIELWERGEQYGARVVYGTRGGSQLIARRVALATAELARNLRQKRRADERAAEHERRRRLLAEWRARTRPLEGPRALRSGVSATLVGPGDWWLVGPALDAQIHVAERTRLDLGVVAGFGALAAGGSMLRTLELGIGPAHRLAFDGIGVDLDLAARAAAGVVALGGSTEVDGIAGQRQSYWARAGVASRVELRLSRSLRLSLGLGAGAVLRALPIRTETGESLRLGGLYLSSELGVVLTPPAHAP